MTRTNVPGLSLHVKFAGFGSHSPLCSQVVVLVSLGNSPSSHAKVTVVPSTYGGDWFPTFTLPLEGDSGSPQMMGVARFNSK